MSLTTTTDIKVTIIKQPDYRVQVTPSVPRGPAGPSPDKSIYSKREIDVYESTVTLDAATATTFFLKMNGNIDKINVINWPNDGKSQRLAIYLKQSNLVDCKVLAWPDNTLWSFGQVPVLTSKPGAVDCVVLDTFDRGENIFAGLVGLDFH